MVRTATFSYYIEITRMFQEWLRAYSHMPELLWWICPSLPGLLFFLNYYCKTAQNNINITNRNQLITINLLMINFYLLLLAVVLILWGQLHVFLVAHLPKSGAVLAQVLFGTLFLLHLFGCRSLLYRTDSVQILTLQTYCYRSCPIKKSYFSF